MSNNAQPTALAASFFLPRSAPAARRRALEPSTRPGLPELLLSQAAHDRHALAALTAYVISCEGESPSRAGALHNAVITHTLRNNHMVTVPDTVVGGHVVPTFRVGQYLCGRGAFGTVQIDPWTTPWTDISYLEAKALCDGLGLALLTEMQALVIATDIQRRPINWTGGAIGHGQLYQGLHQGFTEGPQPATHRSTHLQERRWHVLSNGDIIHDVAGNAYSWIFDDVQGDANGVIAAPFSPNSPSVERADEWPHDTGQALIRGGHWASGTQAGIFHLRTQDVDRPRPDIGFRVTAPV